MHIHIRIFSHCLSGCCSYVCICVYVSPSFKAKQPPPVRFTPTVGTRSLPAGAHEICVKSRHHGWVIGRRATQSHREFFLLCDEKVGNLAEIQEEVDNLARNYFYNIFIY